MTNLAQYTLGPARGARVQKERGQNGEEKWTLVLVRELRQSPEKVWEALYARFPQSLGKRIIWCLHFLHAPPIMYACNIPSATYREPWTKLFAELHGSGARA